MAEPAKKLNWGDVDAEDNLQEEPGLKKVVTYGVNDLGQKTKITKTIKIIRETVRVNKNVERRKKLRKFGSCAEAGPGLEPGVTTKGKDVAFVPMTPEERLVHQENLEFLKKQLINPNDLRIFRDTFRRSYARKNAPGAKQGIPEPQDDRDVRNNTGVYQIVRNRPGARFDARDDSNPALRVTNLSDDVDETVLRNLFGRFGRISRIYVAKDRDTGEPRGFGFVNFVSKRDAENAMENLQGFGLHHLILNIDWAKPRKE